jgi:hypothetical protein
MNQQREGQEEEAAAVVLSPCQEVGAGAAVDGWVAGGRPVCVNGQPVPLMPCGDAVLCWQCATSRTRDPPVAGLGY